MRRQPMNQVELHSKDIARTKHFYNTLFDWAFTDLRADYTLFRSPDGTVGGVQQVQSHILNPGPVCRIVVEDIAQCITRAISLEGGYSTYREGPSHDWVIDILDPDGNHIRLIENGCEPHDPEAIERSEGGESRHEPSGGFDVVTEPNPRDSIRARMSRATRSTSETDTSE
jgi:predicted enzyme related to lactoylglutathione lyase